MPETVVLVHGFFKGASDMRFLADHFQSAGFHVVVPDLPTTFGTLAECSRRLSLVLDALPLGADNRLHLVGHSMGGLIIRHCLSCRVVPGLGRCVLIATPNNGSALAHLYPPGLRFPSIECLRHDAAKIGPPMNQPAPAIGVLAGNRNNLLIGKLFLTNASDGRVTVDSTRFDGMDDFQVLPFGHRQIHFQIETARLAECFLRTGCFATADQRAKSAIRS